MNTSKLAVIYAFKFNRKKRKEENEQKNKTKTKTEYSEYNKCKLILFDMEHTDRRNVDGTIRNNFRFKFLQQ